MLFVWKHQFAAAAEWNHSALSSLMKTEIQYELRKGDVFHFLAHAVQSIILKGTHASPEILNLITEQAFLFPSSVSCVAIHVYTFTRRTCIQAQETNLINVIIMKLPAKEAR